VCVGDSRGESKGQLDSRRIFRTILRPGGRAEPVEVGVLHQVVSKLTIIFFVSRRNTGGKL
jgi:hypothetical protein